MLYSQVIRSDLVVNWPEDGQENANSDTNRSNQHEAMFTLGF